jgi:hypothetical protein
MRQVAVALFVLLALAWPQSLVPPGLVVSGGASPGLLDAADRADAYTFYMTRDGQFPLRWWQRPSMTFTLSTVEPEEISAASIEGLIAGALDTWISTPCGLVPEVVFGGVKDEPRATTPTSLRSQPDNLIVFIRSASEWSRTGNSPTWIAITKIAHDPDSGEVIDADIEINDGGYVFSYDDTTAANEVDVLSMITHELGHFYGLDHSTDPKATMYATYATTPEDAREARSLAQDDIDGICALYTDVPIHRDPSSDDETCAGGGVAGTWWLVGALLLLLGRRTRPPGRWMARS